MIDKYADVNVPNLLSDVLLCKEDILNLEKLVQSNSLSTSLINSIWDSQSKTRFMPFLEDIEMDYKEIFNKLSELEAVLLSIKEYKLLVQEYNKVSNEIDNLKKINRENVDNKDFNKEYNYNQTSRLTDSKKTIYSKINSLTSVIEG